LIKYVGMLLIVLLAVSFLPAAGFIRLAPADSFNLVVNPAVEGGLSTTTIRVYPESLNVSLGETFSVNVTFEGVPVTPGAAGFEFNLSWDPSILKGVSMQDIEFHAVTPQAEWANIFSVSNKVLNSSVLYAYTWMMVQDAIDAGYAPISGNGTLATITLKGVGIGQTTLHFGLTIVGDPDGHPIPNVAIDGSASVTTMPEHDVGILDITTSTTVAIPGDILSIYVTAEDPGTYTETFNVTFYADTTFIASQNVTLLSGRVIVITFIWNTTDVAFGYYTISAEASVVPGETKTSNNILIDGTVQVKPAFHNVAITDVSSDNFVYVGDNVSIYADVWNTGDLPETFNVTANADENLTVIGDEITIGTQSLSLSAKGFITLAFTWNTTGVSPGNYTISAVASNVTGEADLTDNLYVGGQIDLFAFTPAYDINITMPTILTVNPSIFSFDYNLHARLINIGNATVQSTGYEGLVTAVGSTNGTVHLCPNQPGVDMYDFYLPLNGSVQVPLWLMFQPETHWETYNGNFTLQLNVGGVHRTQLTIIGISIDVCQNGAYIVYNNTVSFTWNLTGGSPVYLEAETNLPPGWSYTVDPPVDTLFYTPHPVTVNITAPLDATEGDIGSVTLRAYENSTGALIWQFIYFASTNNKPPTIEVMQPPALTFHGDLTFNATVKDASGIQSVQLYYSVNGGAWNNQSMQWSSGDTFNSTSYALTIPHVPDNSTIQYYMVATDWLGNLTQSETHTMIVRYDLAITEVKTGKTVVGQGSATQTNVTIANQGTLPSTALKIAVYANATLIYTQDTPSLANGTATTLAFTWNTTGWSKGNYTISAYAEPILGETNTSNNLLNGGWIVVSIPGDVDGNGIVNILDAIQQSNAFLATPSSSNWNPNADINGDGVVNILDAIILSNHFLQHYP
jgi:hypothetical protein